MRPFQCGRLGRRALLTSSFGEQRLYVRIGIIVKNLKAIIKGQWHFTNLLHCFRKKPTQDASGLQGLWAQALQSPVIAVLQLYVLDKVMAHVKAACKLLLSQF